MLLPRRVEEVVVLVPRMLYDRVVAELAKAGILHVDEPPRELAEKGERPYTGFYLRVSEKASRLEAYYKALGVEPRRVRGVRLEGSSWEEVFQGLQERYSDVEEEFEKGVQRLSELEAEEQELRALQAVLELVKHIDVDIREALDAEFLGFAFGYLEAPDAEGVVAREAERKGVVAAYERRGDFLIVAAAGDPGKVHSFIQALRPLGWTPITIPEWLPGNPAKAYEAVAERLSAIAGERERLVESLLARRKALDEYYSAVAALRSVARLLANTVFTRTLASFRGFVDTGDSKRLRRILEKAARGAYMLVSLGVRRAAERVPSKVQLPRFIKPFHKLVAMYGEPDPDEIVPTVFVAVTMPLFFALMFPDMGHGLLVLLFAQWYFKRRDPDWRFILSVLGAASMVTGFLAAEFFGPLGAKLIGLPKLWESLGFHTPPLAQPTYAIEEGLGAEVASELLFNIVSMALWIGAFMLAFGTFLGFVDALLKGDKEAAFASKLPMFIFFLSVGLPFLVTGDAVEGGGILKRALLGGEKGALESIVLYGIIVGMLWKLLGEPVAEAIHGGSPLSGLGHAILEVYEMFLMALGNMPSFLRILGLGLAHSGLMMGFTQLYHVIAEAHAIPHVLGVILGGIVYAIGNLLVAGLEAIIAFAHSLRLHFYEWFSKFYSGSGIRFEPVALEGVEVALTG